MKSARSSAPLFSTSAAVAVWTGPGIWSVVRSVPASGVVAITWTLLSVLANAIGTARETGVEDCTSIETTKVANPVFEISSR
jgi:hypothetical protein